LPTRRDSGCLTALAMKFLPLLILAALVAGCSSTRTMTAPQADLSRMKRVYVERQLADDHHLNDLIVAELQRLGREASTGPLTMMPDHVDAIITYSDDWAWDFHSYLGFLNITVRNARNDQIVARGISRHSSPFRKTPEKMVHEILAPLFK
jgi:hypothetical protein